MEIWDPQDGLCGVSGRIGRAPGWIFGVPELI